MNETIKEAAMALFFLTVGWFSYTPIKNIVMHLKHPVATVATDTAPLSYGEGTVDIQGTLVQKEIKAFDIGYPVVAVPDAKDPKGIKILVVKSIIMQVRSDGSFSYRFSPEFIKGVEEKKKEEKEGQVEIPNPGYDSNRPRSQARRGF